MTQVAFQDGKAIIYSNQIGIGQNCCCEKDCDCNNCSCTVTVTGNEINLTVSVGNTVGMSYCAKESQWFPGAGPIEWSAIYLDLYCGKNSLPEVWINNPAFNGLEKKYILSIYRTTSSDFFCGCGLYRHTWYTWDSCCPPDINSLNLILDSGIIDNGGELCEGVTYPCEDTLNEELNIDINCQ